jgi:hypothetical protein
MAGIRVDQAAITAPVRKNTTVVATRAARSVVDAMVGGYPGQVHVETLGYRIEGLSFCYV